MTKAAPPPSPRINSTYHTEMFIRRWQGGLWGTGRLHNIVTRLKTPPGGGGRAGGAGGAWGFGAFGKVGEIGGTVGMCMNE